MAIKKYAVCALCFFMATGIAWCTWWYVTKPAPKPFPYNSRPVLIAHAGGAIEGDTYTNSREAVEQSIQKEFSFIELDLCITPVEKFIVAAHDWKIFFKMLDMSDESSTFLYDAVVHKKLYKKFSILTADVINEIFLKNDSLWLVTDKISDFDILLSQITVPQDRMLVEVFSYKKYKEALHKGIQYPMLCIWDESSLYKHIALLYFKKIKMITIPDSLLTKMPDTIENLYKRGLSVFVFTINDKAFAEQHLNKRITGFYTDTLSPSDFF